MKVECLFDLVSCETLIRIGQETIASVNYDISCLREEEKEELELLYRYVLERIDMSKYPLLGIYRENIITTDGYDRLRQKIITCLVKHLRETGFFVCNTMYRSIWSLVYNQNTDLHKLNMYYCFFYRPRRNKE